MSHKLKSAILCAAAAVILAGCSAIDDKGGRDSEDLLVTSVVIKAPEIKEEDARYGKYIYDRLSEKEQGYYDALVKAVENCESRVYYEDEIDPDTAKKVFTAVYNGEPGLFWLDSLFFRPAGNSQVISYRFDSALVPEMKKELEQKVREILSPTEEMTDYEKVVYIHDYIVLNTRFSDAVKNTAAYGALCGGSCQCEGYAFSFNLLCTKAEIDCITIPGVTSEGLTHAWNMVKLDDIWYNVDCTWDDPIMENGSDDFIRRYYLLLPDSDILNKTHFKRDDFFTYPLCYDSSRNYFQREGYFAYSAAEGINLLEKASEEALRSGSHDAEVRFAERSAYRTASARLFDVGEISVLAANAYESVGIERADPLKGMVKFCNDDLMIIHITFGQ